jgi:hypothetical protein
VHYTKGVLDASTCTGVKPARSARYVSLLLLCIYCEFRRPAPPKVGCACERRPGRLSHSCISILVALRATSMHANTKYCFQYIVHACMQTALHHTKIEVCTTPKASRTLPCARGSNRPAQPVKTCSCNLRYTLNAAGPLHRSSLRV